MPIPTITEVEEFKVDIDAAEEFVNSLDPTFDTRIGGTKDTISGVLSKSAQGTITVYSAATTYTDQTEWVDESGVVYRPLPSELPIGPEVFDSSKWVVAQGLTKNDKIHPPVADYTALRALDSSTIPDGTAITVTHPDLNGVLIARTGTVTDDKMTKIVPTDDSNRYFERDYQGWVHTKWREDIDHDFVSDSTTGMQFVLDNFPNIIIDPGNILSNALVIPVLTQEILCMANISPIANNITLFTIAADVSRAKFKRIVGIRSDADSHTGCTAMKLSSVTNNPSPGAEESILYLHMEDCIFKGGFDTGIDARVIMECRFTNVISINNEVGLKLYTDPVNGGGNLNLFNGCSFQSNTVGTMLVNRTTSGPFSMQNNQFTNCIWQGNEHCGVFAHVDSLSSGIMETQSLTNCHFENNATGGSTTITVDGYSIDKTDIHLSGDVELTFEDSSTSGQVPMVLQDGATLFLSNIVGFGVSTGDLINKKTTDCQVYELGYVSPLGSRNVDSYGSLSNPRATQIIQGPPAIDIGQYRNDCAFDNVITPTLNNVAGVVSIGANKDADFGLVSAVVFDSVAGSTGNNRNYWVGPSGSFNDAVYWSFLMQSSANGSFTFSFWNNGNLFNKSISFVGGQWRRMVFVFAANDAAATELYMYPSDSVGATVNFRGMQQLRSVDSAPITYAYKMGLVGVPNSRIIEQHNVAPTFGTWQVGEFTSNDGRTTALTPDANNMVLTGWLCTASGTPGTHTPQYVSSVSPAT